MTAEPSVSRVDISEIVLVEMEIAPDLVGVLSRLAGTALTVACDGCHGRGKTLVGTMTENIGVENTSSITYYDENLPAMGAGRSRWVMPV